MQEGWDALLNQLDAYRTGRSAHTSGKETLLEAMKIYAPSSDGNKPVEYAQTIANDLGIDINTPISNISAEDWAKAISKVESPQAHQELRRLNII